MATATGRFSDRGQIEQVVQALQARGLSRDNIHISDEDDEIRVTVDVSDEGADLIRTVLASYGGGASASTDTDARTDGALGAAVVAGGVAASAPGTPIPGSAASVGGAVLAAGLADTQEEMETRG